MFRNAILVKLFLCGVTIAYGDWTEYKLDRYQVILDRMPFGKLSLPTKAASPQVDPVIRQANKNSILNNLRLCALREIAGGEVRVGFVNIKEKPPKTYFLYKGQMQDGITVKDVDYEKSMALVQKDSEILWLKMDAGVGDAISGQSVGVKKLKPKLKTAVSNDKKTPKPKRKESYSRRLKERRRLEEERRKEMAAEKAKFTAEELKSHFKDLQMEYIRNGYPALPIPLTPEQDAQLVEEGVLEPLDADS